MDWDEALVHVMPNVPGCPESVALDHIIKAARIFAAKSSVWRRVTHPVKTVANRRTYAMDINKPFEELVKIKEAAIGTDQYDVLDAISGAARQRRESSQRFVYVPSGREDIIINPAPSLTGDEIVLTLVLKPGLSAPTVPEELEDFIEDISHGAIASLCSLPMKTAPWADDKQATLHASIFTKRIGAAASLVSGGYGARPRRTRAVYF
jgi:hypothetical protein